MDTEAEIAAAEKAVEEAHKTLTAAKTNLDALYVRRSTEQYGIEPGMTVKSKDGLFVVDEIKPESWRKSKPWLYGRKIKNDGTPGANRRTIYGEWEIVPTEQTKSYPHTKGQR